MYDIKRPVWFSIYFVGFAVMVWLTIELGTGWVWGAVALVFALFIVLTNPSPRLYEADPRTDEPVECDCPKCTGPCGYVED